MKVQTVVFYHPVDQPTGYLALPGPVGGLCLCPRCPLLSLGSTIYSGILMLARGTFMWRCHARCFPWAQMSPFPCSNGVPRTQGLVLIVPDLVTWATWAALLIPRGGSVPQRPA